MAKPHIHIHNILTTEVASPISLMVSWSSPHPAILLNVYEYYFWLINNKMMMMMTIRIVDFASIFVDLATQKCGLDIPSVDLTTFCGLSDCGLNNTVLTKRHLCGLNDFLGGFYDLITLRQNYFLLSFSTYLLFRRLQTQTSNNGAMQFFIYFGLFGPFFTKHMKF